ncbi:MAG: UDP-N-acetylmuramate:L-alanyl-gamma-D-glutamyl-meso-diaminopimelate ligase [Mariprofundaceae bacterium]|nr:UDP-N-acetylmuramate:L-alanyl-gamma-D-glutamyl-meso-diaminopimelate ligase [Mariprofundaceae bacterium]
MKEVKTIYILGICGTAMAAIASLAKKAGFTVQGSDQGIYPPMSDFLEAQQISLYQGYDAKRLLKLKPDLVLIGNAFSRGNVEVEAVLNHGLDYTSGAEFIGRYLLPHKEAVVVAGTHGKTSTASLMAHVLEQGQHSPSFMIGGIPENFQSGARLGNGKHFVLEGDEYDTAFFDKRSKFLHYHAHTLILNNLEFDHADIFPDLAAIERQFHHLVRTVPQQGQIIVNADDPVLLRVLDQGCWTPIVRIAKRDSGVEATWQWQCMRADGTHFKIYYQGALFLECQWSMRPAHQVANACAVAAAAHSFGLDAKTIQQAFKSFQGIRRRMTKIGEARGIQIYDDFAHHPTAITDVVEGMKASLSEQQRLWVIVEPRSNTMRTRIHQDRLGRCFEHADLVRFVPASDRNLAKNEVLDMPQLCNDIGEKAACLADSEAIIGNIEAQGKAGDVVLILSNGGFEGLHQRLLDTLKI